MPEPLAEKLINYAASGALPMHMPGHKRNVEKFPWLKELSLGLDITEIEGFDNLNDPEGLFSELNERLASLRGADRSFALVNGSTSGILAAFRLCLPMGGAALISRGSHKSVYSAAEICGAKLKYIVPELIPDFGVFGPILPETVEKKLEGDKNISLVCITSPTYEGVISDVKAISSVCHRYGVPLLVDAAHGAHLGFGGFPAGAISSGADIAVESLHKTLPSPTQTAVLSIKSDIIDAKMAQKCVSMFQSSSPSYILSAGIDACAKYMEERGDGEAAIWYRNVKNVRERLEKLENFGFLASKNYDISKLVLSCDNGYRAMELFRENGIELEMSSDNYVIAMTGLGDTTETLERFAIAAEKVDKLIKPAPKGTKALILPEVRLGISEALAGASEAVPIEECEGRVSAEYVWKYPPGSPIIVPGEVISRAALGQDLASLRSTYGMLPAKLYCLK